MSLMDQVKKLWVVERHPKGALAVCSLMDVLERNYRRWKERAQDPGWETLGVFPTIEAAQEGERELKRRYAALRKKAEHGQTPTDTTMTGKHEDRTQETDGDRQKGNHETNETGGRDADLAGAT